MCATLQNTTIHAKRSWNDLHNFKAWNTSEFPGDWPSQSVIIKPSAKPNINEKEYLMDVSMF